MNAVTEMPAPLVFTDSAAAKVKQLIDEEGNQELKLRVFVTGGGCSGFQYGFTFDEAVSEDDTSMEKNGVTLLIDPMSLQYLGGAEIDYQEGIEGAQFVIKNPNATSTCGCGSSATNGNLIKVMGCADAGISSVASATALASTAPRDISENRIRPCSMRTGTSTR
jgi:iron-sulfur cluster insertion protein